MKVLTFSRHFPKGHPKEGQPTWFVEKVWKSLWDAHEGGNNPVHPYWEQYDEAFQIEYNLMENIHQHHPKHHTIRAGSRWKVGDMASLRVWSEKPYRSKQVEFAQVEVKNVWSIEIVISHTWWSFRINDKYYDGKVDLIAKNDGLELQDFIDWFTLHPKSFDRVFKGQIICWSDKVNYR